MTSGTNVRCSGCGNLTIEAHDGRTYDYDAETRLHTCPVSTHTITFRVDADPDAPIVTVADYVVRLVRGHRGVGVFNPIYKIEVV